MEGDWGYHRDTIDDPPLPPQLNFPLHKWMGHGDCTYISSGADGDTGQVNCGDWCPVHCFREPQWQEGTIDCHDGDFYHRCYFCNF
ncbi:hypothetical protein EJ02DRAFT_456552 [Clathrospora elynae]|uniref:Uncharacterized protein n=1 Tax=Clathrospora elynae TaxID=706981 RepID=A0A6A5SJR9_9PLEO|nr:hypothetical protein EJ02DRAFT_456552 [Clathrospora elynae]